MLNHIVIMGRLTRDPELRYTQSQTPVASFTIAVDRDFGGRDGGERQTDFIDCVAWRNSAEFVSKYFHKGSMAVVSGRLQIRDWNDRDGNKRRSAEVVVDNIYFGESKRSEGENRSESRSYNNSYDNRSYDNNRGYDNNRSSGYDNGRSINPAPPAFAELDDEDGEIPF